VGVIGCKPLEAIHLLREQRCGQSPVVREVAVERCLTDAGASRNLTHRGIGAIGE
jgi:hypothetical protein